jgi:hypothetical protein
MNCHGYAIRALRSALRVHPLLSDPKIVATWLFFVLIYGAAPIACGAESLPPGFQRVSGKHVELITDMPLSDELRELPQVFDAAIPQWCKAFGLQEADVADWQVQAFIMLDRERFFEAGLLPQEIADFPYGFQLGDRLWVSEQPSHYYRRHLLLHEGTHWFMTRKYGRYGPPWLMEGLAEWFSTHRWDGQQLRTGVIPQSANEVAYWGRIKLIQQDLASGLAPSLETVLRYDNMAHRQVEAYAWSWAAIVFLKSDPLTNRVLEDLLAEPLQSTEATNRWLFQRLSNRWPELRQRWNAVLTELDYGTNPASGTLVLTPDRKLLRSAQQVVVRADGGWQASGIQVAAGSRLRIRAEGMFVVKQGQKSGEQKPWQSTPSGVSLEYHRGQPLGKLLMTVLAPLPQEPQSAQPLKVLPVGSGGVFVIHDSGELHFRVNESSGELLDNSGTITILLEPHDSNLR